MEQGASSSPQSEGGEVVRLGLSMRAEEAAEDAEASRKLRRDYLAFVNAATDVLNARLLALLSLVGALGVWAWCIVDPTPWRFVACCGFSLGVLWPVILHCYKSERTPHA